MSIDPTFDSKEMLEHLLLGQSVSADQAGELVQAVAAGAIEPGRAGALLAA